MSIVLHDASEEGTTGRTGPDCEWTAVAAIMLPFSWSIRYLRFRSRMELFVERGLRTLAFIIPAAGSTTPYQRGLKRNTAWRGAVQSSVRNAPKLLRALDQWLVIVSAAMLSVCFLSAIQAQTASSTPATEKLTIITTAYEAHSLSDEDAARALTIHLRGVITYFDPDYANGQPATFFHDETAGVFLRMTPDQAKGLFVGAFVDVQGVSGPGGFGPVVFHPKVRVLGHGSLPPHPPRVSLAMLKTGEEDAQWVEVEGSVHRVMEYDHSVTLSLELPDGPINVAMVKEPGATYSNLVDAQVRIRANAAPTTNYDNQMIGVHLQAPNLSALEVLEPAPADPFARPYVSVNKLSQWKHFATPMHRVHVRGNVTLQWPGSLLCIRDTSRGICAQTSQYTPVAIGDLVDVAGFVDTENSGPVITDAVFRSAGNNLPVAPQPVTADNILHQRFASELIQIDGILIGYDLASSDVTLHLASGDAIFPVVLPKSLAGSEVRAWKIGSKLRITGICSVNVDVDNHVQEGVAVTKSFRVLMPSPADVYILEGPSWWTPAHALLILAVALAGTLTVLGWVVVLRKRVELQANQLRESEERFRHLAQHDTLTGLCSRMVLDDRLKDAIKSDRFHQSGLALLILDVDKFKGINDTFGHQTGDEVLRVTAQRLKNVVRGTDTVVRLGGDEFVVLLSEVRDEHAAELVAATVVSSLSMPVRFSGIEIPVSVSVGVGTAFTGKIDAETLLRHADEALYVVKERGRHGFAIYSDELAKGLPDRDTKQTVGSEA